MICEHISKYHDRVNLNIDVDRLGKEYLDFKEHLGFRTDNPANIDFNASPLKRSAIRLSFCIEFLLRPLSLILQFLDKAAISYQNEAALQSASTT